MKKIINLICCLVFLSTQTLLSQTPIWTSPPFDDPQRPGWFVLKNNPIELRFYSWNYETKELKIMNGPLSDTPFLEITLETQSDEYFYNSVYFDYSGDGLNDLLIVRRYPPSDGRYGLRILDVTNGQTLFLFDDAIYSYGFVDGLPADIDGDGKTDLVISRADAGTFSSHQYLVFSTNGVPSALSNDINTLPNELQLYQNYPNPFNPSTTIRYSLTSPEKVFIKIYDVSGQLVKEITKEHNHSGEYEVFWNGTNDVGQKISSGTYFYQLTVGNYAEAKKMILLK